ncbi:beta-1,3-glucan-binding protein-like [Sitophilus oryzae]|uniref:Beta-1,3-glucan-binding protein-like n=1 Tax=Sitophilus oryzae TaxID=7048 RepID=A0A6J2XWX1_SITOR|nr:beta-1,3-glucan-binding protein-like [Sitophilus oryzae]
MDYHNKLVLLLLILLIQGHIAYEIPNIALQAFTPSGLRISVPADPEIKLFGVHFNINKDIHELETGEYNEDISRPENGKFTYFNPTLKLKEGDTVYYWVYLQVGDLGYKKDGEKYTVTKLLSIDQFEKARTCAPSITIVDGESSCVGEVILDAKFVSNTIDENIWLIEQYYADEPDFEYVIYKNDSSVLTSQNNLLHIKPKVDEDIVTSNVNIDGCTRKRQHECTRVFINLYQHPVISARLVTKKTFSFGEYKVRAKLPKGDWLFPEIYLEDIEDLSKKIWISYARGNEELTGNNGDDIGGKLLFGGPVVDPLEPKKSRYLKTYRNNQFIGNEMHTFSLRWTSDEMLLYIDDINYGTVSSTILKETGFNSPRKMRLVIGVGAGGPRDFPDNYKSKSYLKPWKSTSNNQVKMFFTSRSNWLPSWKDSELQVEFVKISAL